MKNVLGEVIKTYGKNTNDQIAVLLKISVLKHEKRIQSWQNATTGDAVSIKVKCARRMFGIVLML